MTIEREKSLDAVLLLARPGIDLRDLPRHIVIGGASAAGFALIVVPLGWSIGADLGFPEERVSMVLGFSAALPLGLAMATYLVMQGVLGLLGRGGRSARTVAGHLVNDFALLALFVIITYLHFNLKMWVPVINPALYDLDYLVIDDRLRWLVDFFIWLSATARTALPDEVRWYQIAFQFLFILSFCYLAVMRREDEYPRFAIGILLVLCLGGLSYLIAPAVGPFIYDPGTDALANEAQNNMLYGFKQVQEQGMPWINQWGSDYFTGALAAMPSLHVAHATVITYYMVVSRSFLAPLFIFFWTWILIDSIALRWHYLVDAPAGFLLAVFVIWLTERLLGARERAPASAEPAPALASRNPSPKA